MCGGGYRKYGYHEAELSRNLNMSLNLNLSSRPWTICAWHKNQKAFQVGGKKDETGYNVYDICKSFGALILTGHEHSYSRTQAIDNVETQHVSQECFNDSCIYNISNETIVTVSGLGGKSIRTLDPKLSSLPYWASTYAGNYGALFCKFNYNGNPSLAYCYFLDVNGTEHDSFFVNHMNK